MEVGLLSQLHRPTRFPKRTTAALFRSEGDFGSLGVGTTRPRLNLRQSVMWNVLMPEVSTQISESALYLRSKKPKKWGSQRMSQRMRILLPQIVYRLNFGQMKWWTMAPKSTNHELVFHIVVRESIGVQGDTADGVGV